MPHTSLPSYSHDTTKQIHRRRRAHHERNVFPPLKIFIILHPMGVKRYRFPLLRERCAHTSASEKGCPPHPCTTNSPQQRLTIQRCDKQSAVSFSTGKARPFLYAPCAHLGLAPQRRRNIIGSALRYFCSETRADMTSVHISHSIFILTGCRCAVNN